MKKTITLSAAILTLSSAGAAALAVQGEPATDLAPQTKANLEAAMHGEAFANLKYLRYAEQADAAGKKELAQLFRSSANIEANEHFDREAEALRLGSSNETNLEDAMSGEHYENTKMYIEFADQAEAEGDLKVAAMFRQIAVDEGVHYDAYKAALAKI